MLMAGLGGGTQGLPEKRGFCLGRGSTRAAQNLSLRQKGPETLLPLDDSCLPRAALLPSPFLMALLSPQDDDVDPKKQKTDEDD